MEKRYGEECSCPCAHGSIDLPYLSKQILMSVVFFIVLKAAIINIKPGTSWPRDFKVFKFRLFSYLTAI